MKAILASLLVLAACDAFAQTAPNRDPVALRRACAHQIKVKLGITETGSVNDLKGVPGAVQMVDRCVANNGKVE